ncbi:MAG: family 1 glycosylhydrolase [Blastocatellia bacterium]
MKSKTNSIDSDTSHSNSGLTRRNFLLLSAAATLLAAPATQAESQGSSVVKKGFPKGFLWGAATAGHQVEGNNINSDMWVLEHAKPTIFVEPSGDACDHYHRYADDIKLLAGLGLNTYRFSIEWSRIEPEQGAFSLAELEHYRRMLAACRENNLTPMVSFNHFSVPRWFAALGGWENPKADELFARYSERAAKHLGDLIAFATTLNEPNVPALLSWAKLPIPAAALKGMTAQAARAVGSDRFGFFILGAQEKMTDTMISAHHRGLAALKSGPGKYEVGVTLSMQDEQAVGPDSRRDEKCAALYGRWLEAASKSDFVGVQTYTRARVGKDGDLPKDAGVELTQMGWEFYPEALEATIRYAAAQAKVPVYVTENGVATEDDSRRVEYIRRALAGVQNCLHDGVDVRGYIHWSLLDSYEWFFGYRPKFGLIAVDRATQKRTVRPGARFLGEIALHNGLH